jgi:nucleoside-diphosphate-sugar epimerase
MMQTCLNLGYVKKLKNIFQNLTLKLCMEEKDPDQRDYFVSNEKLKTKGFEAKVQLDTGIKELIDYFRKQ